MSWFGSEDEAVEQDDALLANQSLLLLLILVNHCTQEKKLNLYRLALFSFTNSKPKGWFISFAFSQKDQREEET